MGALKIFFIVVISIVIFVLSMVGLGVFGIIGSIASSANQKVEQKVEFVDSKIKIYVPLIKNRQLALRNISLCKDEITDENNIKLEIDNKFKLNNTYLLTFSENEFKKGLPRYIYIYKEDSTGNCKKIRYNTEGNFNNRLNYSVKIEFTDKLTKLLGLNNQTDYNVSSPKSFSTSVYQFLGTKKAKFTYSTKQDYYDLLINNVKKAVIIPTEK